MHNYYFNCDLGDTIYSLIILKYFGGGGYFYGPSHSSASTHYTKKAESLKSLLEYQEYVTSFGFTDKLLWRDDYPPDIIFKDISLDIKDLYFNKLNTSIEKIDKSPNLFWTASGLEMVSIPLIQIISQRFLIDENVYKEKWINLPNVRIHDKDIIMNRTFRYNQNVDLYIDIIKKNGENKCGFIGTEQEYEKFCFDTKLNIEHIKTKDLFQAGIAIKNSKVFVGNQSSCMAIAESIKHNTIQEVYINNPNCLFSYRNNFYGVLPGRLFGFPEKKHIAISKSDFNECGIKIERDTWYDEPERISFNNNSYEIRGIEI